MGTLNQYIHRISLFWQQLIIYGFVALLPIVLLVSWLYHHNQQQVIRLKSEQLLLIAQEKFQQMHLYLQAQKSFVQQAANTPTIIQATQQTSSDQDAHNHLLQQTADNFLSQHHHDNLFIVNTAGTLLFTAHHHMALGENLTDPDWRSSSLGEIFQHIEDKPIAQGYRWDESQGELVGLIAAPVINNQHIVGYLIVQLNKTWLQQFINQRQGLGDTGEISLGYQRADGAAVPLLPTRYPDHSNKQRERLNGEPIPLEKAVHGETGWGESYDYRGEPTIAAWLYEPETNLGLVVKQDKRELFHELQTQKQVFLASLTLLTLFIIGLAHFQSRKQSHAIQQLVQQAKDIGHLQHHTHTPTQSIAPELTELMQAINRADVQIKQQLLQLEHINTYLEAQIQKKTAELNEYILIVDEHVLISRFDLNGVITYASTAFCQASGYARKELLGNHQSLLCHPNNPATLYETLWSIIMQGKPWQGELQNLRKDGSSYWTKTSISPIFDNHTNQLIGHMAVLEDITDRKRAECLSVTDEMTQLYNRRHFNEQIDVLWRQAAQNQGLLTLIMIDVDYFKNYNDALGHHEGDLALIAVAQAIQAALPGTQGQAFRLGGEEMAILAILSSPDEGITLANQIQTNVNQRHIPHPSNRAADYVTVSIGLCFFDARRCQQHTKSDMDALYQQADAALYQAKQAGRNCVIACSQHLTCTRQDRQHRL